MVILFLKKIFLEADCKKKQERNGDDEMSVYIRKCQRKKGYVYQLVFDTTDAKGRRKRTTKTLPQGTSKAQAEKIANKMELDIEFGEYVEHDKTTLKDYCENIYLTKYIKASNLSPTTIKGYRQMLETEGGIYELMGDKYINTIGTEQIQDYCNIQKDKYNRSSKTIKNHLGLISGIMERAMIDKYVTRKVNPCKYVIIPKSGEKHKIQAYSLEEVKTILSRAQKENNYEIMSIVGLCTLGGGLRRGELCGLKMSDCHIYEEKKYIQIQRNMVQVKGGYVLKDCKTDNSEREVPIGNTLAEIIQQQQKINYKRMCDAGEEYAGGDFLLTMDKYPYGNMKPNYVYNRFKKFMRESCPDLPCLRLHDLRASYASIAADLNFNENNLTAALGHSSIATTKKHYIKVYKDSLRKDVDRLEEAYESVKIAE